MTQNKSPSPKKKIYTEEELEAAVAEALAKKQREEAEQHEAGQKSADKDVIEEEKHIQKLVKENEQIAAQLQQVKAEIQRLQGLNLNLKHQQLEQRINDLEKIRDKRS